MDECRAHAPFVLRAAELQLMAADRTSRAIVERVASARAFGCAILVSLCACDAFYEVHGRISSCADHRPLSGVILHVKTESREGFAKTAADGTYRVALNEPEGDNPSKLTVAKIGYVTEEHAVANPHIEQNVCLRSEGR
jgi:hypothetical protein